MSLKKHLATLLLLFCVLSLSAQVKEKRITISFSSITLADAMKRIENASGYTFFYDASQIDTKQTVSLSVKDQLVKKAVETMLKPTNLACEVTNTQIALLLKDKKETVASGKATTIKGVIVDELGEPVIGANVMVEGATTGSITDLEGRFTVTAAPHDNLKISYIGYVTQVVKAGSKSVIKLVEDAKTLDEVVVVGYGTMKKKDLTGAVNTLKASDMEKEQRQTIQDMLRSGVAGMSVGIETDTKGNTAMMIRGQGTIKAKSDPLVVLDGVIYPGQITDINPNDIEQIDVLKDASSAAVYGAQAANGVVLITTKKGTGSKKPTISFNGSVGLSFNAAMPEVYTGQDFVNFRRDVMKSIEGGTKAGNYYDNPANMTNTELADWMGKDKGEPAEVWLTRLKMTNTEIKNYMGGNSVDWKDLIYQDVAMRQDYTVSIAGKKDEMSYYSSLNYLDNQSNVRGGGYSAIRARVNIENKVQKFLTYGVNAQFTARNEGYVGNDTGSYTALSPYGSIYEADGSTLKYYPNDNNNATNPLVTPEYVKKKNDIENLNASIYLKVDLPLGFSVQTTYSPRFEWTNYLEHKSAEHPGAGTEGGYVKRQSKKDFYWQWDNMLKWNKTLGKHAFDFTFLANWEKFQRWDGTMTNSAFQPSDNLGYHGIAFGTIPTTDSNDIYRTGDAYMGRLHYVFDQRYLITATVRRDGYSAFGISNPRATFPAVALGWVFSEEKFIPKPNWFEYGKLRFSWGKNGNRSIGEYAALMQLSPRKYIYVDPQTGKLINANTFFCSNMANPGLKWETTASYNVGLDFSFLQGRLGGSVDVYKKKTTDLLNSRQLPDLIGYASVTANIGEVQNTGLELTLNSTNIKTHKITWRTIFNIAYNKNTINHLYGLMEDVKDASGNVIGQKEADDITNGYFIGHALDEIWGYEFQGVWQQGEEELAAKYGQTIGDPKILDVDDNKKYNNDDKVFQGNKTPKVRWNMRNEFTLFNNINFSFSMYSYLGHKKSLGRFSNDNALLNTTNQIRRDYWTPDNPINDYPRLGAKKPSGVSYSIYKNASFVRFDNVSVGYSFPKKLIEPFKISALNMNLTLKNAGYISGWSGYDPENSDSNTPRVVYFGINLTL